MTQDEYESENGYLDTDEFRAFTVLVHEAIQGPSSIGDIRRVMGDEFNARMIWDAIEALEGAGAIKKLWGVPSKFIRKQLPPTEKKGRMGIHPAPPADRTKPMPCSFPEPRDVGA